jgi:hypothetical protein
MFEGSRLLNHYLAEKFGWVRLSPFIAKAHGRGCPLLMAFPASPTFTLHIIVHVDPWLCPPAVVVVFAATFAMSSNTSCISSPVTAEHSA